MDVVINYLPVGSEMATKWYVEQILEARCAMVNCIPVFIAKEEYWSKRFEERGVPIVGDDIKSQLGATITHRVLTRLFEDRGVKILNTYQLNFGGNTDFLNLLERERTVSKRISKTSAVTSKTENGATSVLRGALLEVRRSTWKSSWKSGIAPTQQAWLSMRYAALSWPLTGASAEPSKAPAPTL